MGKSGTAGEIRTLTVMILSHLPPANWATAAYRFYLLDQSSQS